ncbi:MAG: hypothetical protein BBJ57_07330 [Desulfobacterales bacterium PC51MH44]|nr:MAG: hypothetical protein BBJ57_07330 [Desulfobacterales bacterium PC51MH44]
MLLAKDCTEIFANFLKRINLLKWFKHLSGSLNNSVIAESVERFGGDGYLVFFGILEMVSDEFDIYNPGRVTLRMKKITKNLQLSRQKTVRILRFFDEKAKLKLQEDVSFFVEIEKGDVTIKCSRLAKLSDNHTQKRLKETSKLLPSDFEVTSLQEEEEEVEEEDKDNTPKEKGYCRPPPCPQKKIISLYNKILFELPRVESWPKASASHLMARWREDPKRQLLENWEKFFYFVKESKFLMGNNNRGWKADLFWLVRPTNFAKVLSQKYHDKDKSNPYEEFINESIEE